MAGTPNNFSLRAPEGFLQAWASPEKQEEAVSPFMSKLLMSYITTSTKVENLSKSLNKGTSRSHHKKKIWPGGHCYGQIWREIWHAQLPRPSLGQFWSMLCIILSSVPSRNESQLPQQGFTHKQMARINFLFHFPHPSACACWDYLQNITCIQVLALWTASGKIQIKGIQGFYSA